MVYQLERIALAGQIVVDAAQHHRAAMTLRAGRQFLAAEPDRPFDAVVEPALRMVPQRPGGKGEAQEAVIQMRRLVVVEADQGGEFDLPAAFLQGLA